MRILHVGGVVAMGFDPRGEFLLVISHDGRGVFSTQSWERIARDTKLAYPVDGVGVGIGPIEGVRIIVTEIDYKTGMLTIENPSGAFKLEYESGAIIIREMSE